MHSCEQSLACESFEEATVVSVVDSLLVTGIQKNNTFSTVQYFILSLALFYLLYVYVMLNCWRSLKTSIATTSFYAYDHWILIGTFL